MHDAVELAAGLASGLHCPARCGHPAFAPSLPDSGCCASDHSSCRLALVDFHPDSHEAAVVVVAEKDAAAAVVVAVASGTAGSASGDS